VSVVPAGSDFIFKPIQQYAVGSIGAGELYTVQFDVAADGAVAGGSPSFKAVYMNGNNWHETAPLTVRSDNGAAAAVAASNAAADSSAAFYVAGLVALMAAALGGVFIYARGKRVRE
jgi:hypothetical protein